MIYLDNAATGGYKPDSVISAACAAMAHAANPGRSGHSLSLACMERVVETRKILNDFFGGYGFERVVFTKNCTEALNIAILGGIAAPYSADGARGVRVLTTVAEHNSVLRPLEELKRRGAEVEYMPLDGRGRVDVSAFSHAVNNGKPPRAAVVTLASNVTGTAPDIAAIRGVLPPECLLICDGAQACGHVPIDMRALKIDALAVAGHKGMLGIQGSGALLFSERFDPAPIMFGGTGSESYNLSMPDFYPDRLESGTLNFPAVVSLAEGAMFLKDRIAGDGAAVEKMTAQAVAGLKDIRGAEVFSVPNPYGLVAFRLANMQSEMVAYALSEEFGICVRGGLHCAPLMHRALGSDGLVRASFSAFSPRQAVSELIGAAKALSLRR